MPQDRFLIAPFNSGFQTNLKPFLIPDDAFAELKNAYVFRGRVTKRFGSMLTGFSFSDLQLSARLSIQVSTVASGVGTVPGTGAIGQLFSAGTQTFTVWQTTGSMLTSGPGAGTFDTTTGAFVITGTGLPGATPIFWYPSQPVMGLTIYNVGAFNNQPAFAFDTQFAYRYTGSAWIRSGAAIWHGTNLNFFWATNWKTINGNTTMYVSNFYALNPNGAIDATDDPIWYMTAIDTWVAASGVNAFYFLPNGGAVHTGPYVLNSRIILPWKNRLLLLNTIESNGTDNTNYTARARWSADADPLLVNAWYEFNQTDTSGNIAIGAGYADASTDEQIIGAEFIKDRLIVFFQSSTWELVFTGNQESPFYWQTINSELGAESQNATIPFDKAILTIGNVGVHACNGSNVQRIDDKIPDQVFNIKDVDLEVTRVAGIRDYYEELAYWAFPSDSSPFTYPDQILVYNYQNATWAVFDDCFTVFGYFEQSTGVEWQYINTPWLTMNSAWNDGEIQAESRQIIAGNQQGFISIITDDLDENAPNMQITNIVSDGLGGANLTIIDHTLVGQEYYDYIHIIDPIRNTGLNNLTFKVNTVITAGVTDPNVININPAPFTGIYTGGSSVQRVSNIQILSKQWNPYLDQGNNMYLNKIEFGVSANDTLNLAPSITVDYYPSASNVSMIQGGVASGAIMGTGVLELFPNIVYYPLEEFQTRLWHPVYFQSFGECIQIFIYFSPQQMLDNVSAFGTFELDGMVLYTERTGRLQ